MAKFQIFITILFLPFFTQISAQYKKTATCAKKDFDDKVNGYLKYTAPVIQVNEAHNQRDKIIFFDAREASEYKISHIPKARFVGFDDFNLDRIKDVSKESKIVVYCSIGYRSEKIATKLIKAGYKNVFNLYGSLFEWVNAGYETGDQSGKTTKMIHTYNKDWSRWVTNSKAQKVW